MYFSNSVTLLICMYKMGDDIADGEYRLKIATGLFTRSTTLLLECMMIAK